MEFYSPSFPVLVFQGDLGYLEQFMGPDTKSTGGTCFMKVVGGQEVILDPLR